MNIEISESANNASKPFDVAILGWWYGKNYGSILTYYGLNRAIQSLGLKILMVHEALGYNGWRVSWSDDILSIQFAKRVGYSFNQQEHFSKLPALNTQADTFVVGSDQLWNPSIGRVNDDLFLDFVNDQNKRVAYGTSFGNASVAKFKPEFIDKHSPNLQKFTAISVREKYAIDIARDKFGVSATQVVDPVFLLPRTEYDALADRASVHPTGDYLAVFFLDPTPEKKRVALAVAEKLGLQKIEIIPNPDGDRNAVAQLFEDDNYHIAVEDSPENFLSTYRGAKYVVTDSFHGTVFAIIFEKPFSSIYNAKRGIDRFESLMDFLGLGASRRIFETDRLNDITNNKNVSLELDFSAANRKLEAGRAFSMQWLREALLSKAGQMRAKLAKRTSSQPAAAGPSVAKEAIHIEKPAFSTNNSAWRVETGPDGVQLTLNPGKAVRGNLVWCELPRALALGQYRASVRWSPRTTAKVVNFHLRKRSTGEFKVVGRVDMTQAKKGMRVDKFEFSCTSLGFNQVMLGAVQFLGEGAGAQIVSISIEKISKTAERQPTKPNDKSELAIPKNTPDRIQIIQIVMQDSKVRKWRSEISALLPEATIFIARELKEFTNNKVGGPADILVLPQTAEELSAIIEYTTVNTIPLTVLGNGSNVVVRDGGIRGVVVLTTKLNYLRIDGNTLVAGTGASLADACYLLLDHAKMGLEWAVGIPGTIGGAVFMNAGTNVSDIRRTLKSVQVIDRSGKRFNIDRREISWGKRYTTFQDRRDWTILEASFHVSDGDPTDIQSAMSRTVQVRENHFPLQNPNHGSTFKWWRAPRLIMQAGLVGTRIGGAQISEKQPGFFINVNQATASDYEALINLTIARVYEFSGFLLEPEVEIIGERPHRYERYDGDDGEGNLDQR